MFLPFFSDGIGSIDGCVVVLDVLAVVVVALVVAVCVGGGDSVIGGCGDAFVLSCDGLVLFPV